MTNQTPLVSIFMICKNRVDTIRRSIESVLAQDYPKIEYIVQDGDSTDGTLEILREYGNRINLVSELDSGIEEASSRVLNRCKGDVIAPCWSDDELLPYAVSWAVENLSKYPDVAAIYGDYYTIDAEGNVLNKAKGPDPFTLERYLCHEIVPPFCSSFFRRSCLEEIGVRDGKWRSECNDFELWIRLGVKFPIKYVPGLVSKFGVHPGSNTSGVSDYLRQIPLRIRTMEKFFDDPDTLQRFRPLRERAYAGLHLWVATTFIGQNRIPEAKEQVKNAFQYQLPEKIQYPYFHGYIVPKICEYGIQLLQSGSTAEALEYLDLALIVNKSVPNLNHARAVALANLGKMKESVAAAKSELQIQPEHSGAKQILQELSKQIQIADYKTNETDVNTMDNNEAANIFRDWISKFASAQNRLYYRDQTLESLNALVNFVHHYKPTKIIELGTLSGLSLRTWLTTETQAEIIAIDLSFKPLYESQKIVPVDLSRVKLLEQNALQTDYGQLWHSNDKVLFYFDAHDLPNVPIMRHFLSNAVPALPAGSVVIIDDLWYSPNTLTNDNARQFFENTVLNEIDPLQCFDGYYAPYWKGGSFFGFLEVIPLMEWVNRNQVNLTFEQGIKSVAFTLPLERGEK